MSAELDAYKKFVDGLVNYKGSVTYIIDAFETKRWNHPPSAILNDLPDEVREAVVSVMRKAAETAIHDVLVQIVDGEYALERDGVRLACRPFDGALHDDFIARVDGIPWPDEHS
ncbi:DUF6547 family protein [Luteolibacter soli]|uniref:DUF6547 family protein n=1 Tax=Luteolibacter soli TaxID=3135280 RepID=A0ABU9B1T7_9BACT